MSEDLASMLNAAMSDHSLSYRAPVLSEIFDEEPVSLTEFVTGKKYLDNPLLSPIQYEAVRHIERIYLPDLYPIMGQFMDPYWAEPVRMVNFIEIMWGKGGGKDHICRMSSLRVAYLLLCLKSPQAYFKMPAQDTIHMINVAASAPQALRAFFKPITRAVTRGWFADHCEPLTNVIQYDKNVEAISGNSEVETQEGMNLILGVADEIDAFKSKEQTKLRGGKEPLNTVEGILDMIHTSGSTRFPKIFKNVMISYPRYKGSPIMREMAKGRKDIDAYGEDSRHYVSGPFATWDVNPRIEGKEDFTQDYRDDPILASAKYECKPAFAITPYFRNEQALEDSMLQGEPDPLRIDGYYLSDRNWVPEYRFSHDLRPIQGAAYAMHGDLALNGDAAGVAMAHVVRMEEREVVVIGEEGEEHTFTESRPIVKVDFVIGYEADAAVSPAREVQIRWARNLAFDLRKRGFNVQLMTFDGFQSADSMQILASKGIASDKASTDKNLEAWRNLRDLMAEGRLIMPFDEKLKIELLSLNHENGKVDHPPYGSKDLADAVACAVLGAVVLGGEEDPEGSTAYFAEDTFTVGSPLEPPIGMDETSDWSFGIPNMLDVDYYM